MSYLLGCGHPDKGDCDGYCTAEREALDAEPFADLNDNTLACGHPWTGTVWEPICVQGCPAPAEPDHDDGLDDDLDDDFDDDLELAGFPIDGI
ncbi:hypothetical protein [Kitasatospora sp. GP82]|uniref:hypothetical protein n=1 Tax=Kitasatospora sp. GP82 TaxID=3035089 RepID=UPI00247634C2|nr:hypothetical protein [Kitasatospora sp. GP82]